MGHAGSNWTRTSRCLPDRGHVERRAPRSDNPPALPIRTLLTGARRGKLSEKG